MNNCMVRSLNIVRVIKFKALDGWASHVYKVDEFRSASDLKTRSNCEKDSKTSILTKKR